MLAGLSSQASVTAARADREIREIPLHVETLTADAIAPTNPLSTGDALAGIVNITPVGNGPFGVRPRLRGLDSTRLLVLVDGERLNTARQATDRTGAEVGLISTDVISRLEIVNGAGTLMYGSDALGGTINIVTNEPSFTDQRRFLYGFDGYYSSNEQGRRGTLTVGVTAPRYAVRIQGGAENFDNYKSGSFDIEDTNPLFASGALRQMDSVADANLGITFRSFPDPFNAPFVRTDDHVANSQAKGHFVNASSVVALGDRQTLRVRYQQRRMSDIGFPDFADPYFFNATSLPHSRLDRVSGRYELRTITPWLASVSLTGYYQRTERLLDNVLPVQFAAPTPGVRLPISVFRLNIHSETEQRVWTPGVDLQAVLVPATSHLVTAGMTVYRDRSSDNRRTTTATTMIGLVVPAAGGAPTPVVFPEPIVLGLPQVDEPVRVPDATFRDLGLFVQDEWRVRPNVLVMAGVRADLYRVATDPTPGYDLAAVVNGATPAIDPATLPDPDGATYTRTAVTGDVGVLMNAGGTISPFVRVGRSYRHPNLEEMLFAGPATIGSIAPNVLVKPETGTNLDLGAKFRAGRITGGAYVFVNDYDDFIAQDLVVAATPRGPLAQATNYADVRIRGLEISAETPVTIRHGVLSFSGAGAFTHGTIVKGRGPAERHVARWESGRQHHAGEGHRHGAIHGIARAVVGRVRRARADRSQPRRPDAARIAVPHRPGSVIARRLRRPPDRRRPDAHAWARPRAADARDREPRRPVLPRALPVRAGARPQRDARPEHRIVLRCRRRSSTMCRSSRPSSPSRSRWRCTGATSCTPIASISCGGRSGW